MLKHLYTRHQASALLGADIASVIRPYTIALDINSLSKRILTTLDRSVMPCTDDTLFHHVCKHSVRTKIRIDIDMYDFMRYIVQ